MFFCFFEIIFAKKMFFEILTNLYVLRSQDFFWSCLFALYSVTVTGGDESTIGMKIEDEILNMRQH